MEWNQQTIDKLQTMFAQKHQEMAVKLRTDRKNLSAHWNMYLKNLDATLLTDVVKGKGRTGISLQPKSVQLMLSRLIEMVNHQNDLVKDSLVISNPDRRGQFIILPRAIAERVLVFGMI